MLKKIPFLALFFFMLQPVFCNDGKMAQVQSIDRKVDEINSCTSYSLKSKKVESFPSPDSRISKEFTAYMMGKRIDKISENITTPFSHIVNNYYFDKENLIFSSSREESYGEKQPQPSSSNMEEAFSGQYYFVQGRMIEFREEGNKQYKTENEPLDEDVIDMPSKEKELLETATHYMKLLKK